MNLTEEQKRLLCDLIDGYFYPRFLCQCDPTVDTEGKWDRTKEFLEIRQVLEPDPNFDFEDEDTYPPHFQHGYWEHDNFDKLDENEEASKANSITVYQFGYEVFKLFKHDWPDENDFSNTDYSACDFNLLLSKIRTIRKRADTLKELVWILQGTNVLNIIKEVSK